MGYYDKSQETKVIFSITISKEDKCLLTASGLSYEETYQILSKYDPSTDYSVKIEHSTITVSK